MAEVFGTRLRAARFERGITQKALAESGGITPASLNLLEKGRNKMVRADVAIRMADAMGVSARWMVLGEGMTEANSVDAELLGRVIRFCDSGLEEFGLSLSGGKRAEVITALYQLAINPESEEQIEGTAQAAIALAVS